MMYGFSAGSLHTARHLRTPELNCSLGRKLVALEYIKHPANGLWVNTWHVNDFAQSCSQPLRDLMVISGDPSETPNASIFGLIVKSPLVLLTLGVATDGAKRAGKDADPELGGSGTMNPYVQKPSVASAATMEMNCKAKLADQARSSRSQ